MNTNMSTANSTANPHALVEPRAYAKIMLHAAKYPSAAIGGFVIGSTRNEDTFAVEDVIPMCHYAPCGPMFDVAAEMIESLLKHKGTAAGKITGYYFANESAAAPRPAYVDAVIESINAQPDGPRECLVLELQNDMIRNKNAVALRGSVVMAGQSKRTVLVGCSDLTGTNASVDKLLMARAQYQLMDFEDHMDTADAAAYGDVAHDFRNLFIDVALM